jgi:DNA-binding GntR family transcriptional regulator
VKEGEEKVTALRPEKPTTLRAHAASVVREMVVAGELEPGQRVNEVELSRQLELSRGILREALSALEQEGLLESKPRRGVFIRRLTPEEASDISEVRLALEITGALRIIRGDTEPALAVIEARYEDLERLVDEPYPMRVRADLAFHESVCSSSGNAALLRSWQALMGSYLAMLLSVRPSSATLLAPERHRPLVDAIRSRDAEVVDAAWHEHFAHGVSYIVSHISTGD